MGTVDRGQELAAKFAAGGVRATVDPSAVNPPAVLIVPPARVYDLGCGYSAAWTLIALAAGAQGADRTTWGTLDELVDAVAGIVDLERADPVAYTLNGVAYPAYLCTFTEAI